MRESPAAAAEAIPALFRTLKNIGFVACLAGALVMIAGRFMPGAPRWITYLGVSVIFFGWGFFAYALVQRAAYLRVHASPGDHQSAKS